MSQDALDGLIGMSRTWLSQVERGIRCVDRLSTLNDLATVLRIDVADLTGRDWTLAPDAPEQVTAMLPGLIEAADAISALRGHSAWMNWTI
jgi:transcriptional regulator with XRE-family HTH domain